MTKFTLMTMKATTVMIMMIMVMMLMTTVTTTLMMMMMMTIMMTGPQISEKDTDLDILKLNLISGLGFTLAPAVGKALCELVQGQCSSFDLTPFQLKRFSTGRGKDSQQ